MAKTLSLLNLLIYSSMEYNFISSPKSNICVEYFKAAFKLCSTAMTVIFFFGV